MRPARILLAFLACGAGIPGLRRPRRGAVGQGDGLSDRHPRQLVLRRKRAGWIVQPSRRAAAALYAEQSRDRRCRCPPRPVRPKFDYRFENQTLTLDDFLAHQRVTGLLVIKDGAVLFERYQYDRKPADRFVSHSMAKSIVSLARRDGACRRQDRLAGRSGRQIRAEARRQSPMARPRSATSCECRPACRSARSMTATTT